MIPCHKLTPADMQAYRGSERSDMVTRIVPCFALSQSYANSDYRGAIAPLHPH